MYGTPVGKAGTRPIVKGEAITVDNIRHYAAPVTLEDVEPYHWQAPDVSDGPRTFKGYVRDDGRVGTAELTCPLVFCENRNVDKLTNALNYTNNSLKKFALNLTVR
ncbi:hypothetical protein ACLB1N_20455 [Escherichia coli]